MLLNMTILPIAKSKRELVSHATTQPNGMTTTNAKHALKETTATVSPKKNVVLVPIALGMVPNNFAPKENLGPQTKKHKLHPAKTVLLGNLKCSRAKILVRAVVLLANMDVLLQQDPKAKKKPVRYVQSVPTVPSEGPRLIALKVPTTMKLEVLPAKIVASTNTTIKVVLQNYPIANHVDWILSPKKK